MIGTIENSTLKFKFGSLEWLNYFGTPFYLLVISILNIYFISVSSGEKLNSFLIIMLILVTLTCLTYYLQKKKLKLEVLKTENSKVTYDLLKEMLLKEDWYINAHRKSTVIQATKKNSSELLTFVFEDNSVKWNVIFHPYNQNSLKSVFANNKNGKRIVEKIIKASA